MSTRQETILGVLSYDEALTKAEIVERTGFEDKEVSNDLNNMRVKGEVARADGGGWILGGGATASKIRVHTTPPAVIEPANPRAHARVAKKRRAPKSTQIAPKLGRNGQKKGPKGAKATRAPAAPNAAVEVAKFGGFTVVRTADLASLLSELSRWHGILVSAIA